MQLVLSRGQALQRHRHRIEAAFQPVQALPELLRIEVPLGFELADAVAGTPPGDAKADGTDAEDLGSDGHRAEKETRQIHSVHPGSMSGGLPDRV